MLKNRINFSEIQVETVKIPEFKICNMKNLVQIQQLFTLNFKQKC